MYYVIRRVYEPETNLVDTTVTKQIPKLDLRFRHAQQVTTIVLTRTNERDEYLAFQQHFCSHTVTQTLPRTDVFPHCRLKH